MSGGKCEECGCDEHECPTLSEGYDACCECAGLDTGEYCAKCALRVPEGKGDE